MINGICSDMNTRSILRLAFQNYNGKANLNQLYEYVFKHKSDWDYYNVDYKHSIRRMVFTLKTEGKLIHKERSFYEVINDI